MISSYMNKIKDTIEKNIRKLHKVKINGTKVNAKISIILVVAVLFTSFALIQFKKSVDHEKSTRAFKVVLGDKDIGIVRDKQEIIDLIDSVQKQLSKDYNLDIVIKEKLAFEDVHAEDKELTANNVIEKGIKSNLTFSVAAFALKVDGKDLVYLKSEDEAKQVLDRIKQPYIDSMKADNSKVDEVKIVEDVKIEKKEVPVSKVEDFEKALATLQKGTDEVKTHVVENGENYWTISRKYNLSVEDLQKANPGKNSELVHPGDEISLIVPKPYLTVATYEEKIYQEKIDFETEYEYSSSMYEDQEKVKRKGVPGEYEVVAKVEKHNGIEIAKQIIKETLVSQPVAQIMIKGTKQAPPKEGTGSFIMPTRGTLTSRFGKRWGKMHEGIDLGARIGTAIKAADGGTVKFAGYNGNYGYMVEIDHGGGFTTRYAHCSKLYVKKGDKVYKDQTIALVGNTGNSTGPHLHFEVRKHGVAQNPYNYIGKKYN